MGNVFVCHADLHPEGGLLGRPKSTGTWGGNVIPGTVETYVVERVKKDAKTLKPAWANREIVGACTTRTAAFKFAETYLREHPLPVNPTWANKTEGRLYINRKLFVELNGKLYPITQVVLTVPLEGHCMQPLKEEQDEVSGD